MSNDRSKGQPADDRTLLDPLNADELEALREARARLQANQGPKSSAAVISTTPKKTEDDGDGPTKAMMPLPSFGSSGVTLDSLGPPSSQAPKLVADPKPLPQGGLRIPVNPGSAQAASSGGPATPSSMPTQNQPAPHGGPGGPPQGFGENTLMWMTPAKLPEQQVIPERGAAAAGGATLSHIEQPKKKTAVLVGAIMSAAVLLLLAYIFVPKGEPSVVELVTNPPKAAVRIDGKATPVTTPMKATLAPGEHEIEVSLADHEPQTFKLVVQSGAKPSRRDIDLKPISKPGFKTVSIAVQPVSANITWNGTVNVSKKSAMIANVDPKAPNKLVIEAGGYQKIEQDIPPGSLKESYTFVLQKEPEQK